MSIDTFTSVSSSDPVLKVTDAGFVKQLLEKGMPHEQCKRELRSCKVSVVKSHLGKIIIEYALVFNNNSNLTNTYIGAFRKDGNSRSLEHAFSILRLLRSSGFDEDCDLRVPKPILLLSSLPFMLMEKAEGSLLAKLLEEGKEGADLEPHMQRAARWLAKLHNSGLSIDETRSSADGIAASLKFKAALAQRFPSLSSKIQSTLEQVIRTQKDFCYKSKLIHGDYNPTNIFSSPKSTTVIDFPESCMGDPAFDLGYFVAHVKMSYGFGPIVVEATDMFLRKYLRESPSEDSLEKRAIVYEAQTYFQRLYHTYCLLKMKPNFELISEWLRESEISLKKAGELRC